MNVAGRLVRRNRVKLWTLALTLLAFGIALGAVQADEDQAYLALFAETSMTVMPMMAGMADMLENLPAGIPLPPEVKAMLEGGKPERKLTVRLWSPGLAPKNATAWIAPPEGLRQGKRLDLSIYRPTPDEAEGAGEVALPPGMPKFEEMTIKIYWGSSPTVRPGQPKVIRIKDMPLELSADMRAKMQRAMEEGGSYFYKPDWTTAYWPNDKKPVTIAEDASLVGSYALTTSYTGNVTIEAPEEVDFLAPFELTSPEGEEGPNLEEALALVWEQIPHALGIHASIVGFEGRNTIVMWSSAETMDEGNPTPDMEYLEMAQVRAYVEQGLMMPGETTEVTVPEGIFAQCMMPMLTMTGYGPGASLPEGQPLPRIQTKTTLTMQLGKMTGMAGMGGFGDMGGDN